MHEKPIYFSYDASTGIRLATYRGTIDDKNLLEAYRELIVQPDFDPLAHDLADLRGVEHVELTPNGLNQLAIMLSGGGSLPRPSQVAGLAIVADTPVAYGIARMYEMMTESFLPKETRVFREFDDALSWLLSKPRLRWPGS